jgi:hypothetical protein
MFNILLFQLKAILLFLESRMLEELARHKDSTFRVASPSSTAIFTANRTRPTTFMHNKIRGARLFWDYSSALTVVRRIRRRLF